MNQSYKELPTMLEWLEIIGVEPTVETSDEGYYCFNMIDASGVALQLSYNIFERSIQTQLTLVEQAIETVSHEGLTEIKLRSKEKVRWIDAWCWSEDTKTHLHIGLDQAITIQWSTLRV